MKKNDEEKRFQSTQSLIPIREICDGVIITTDNRYVKILEILPINFLMRSHTEQNDIAVEFRNLFKTGPSSLQFKIISRYSNMKKHLEILKEEIIDEDSIPCLDMEGEYAELLRSARSRGSISRRFFLTFEYENEGGVLSSPTKSEIIGEMKNVSARIIAALAGCGNEIVTPEDEDEYTLEILFSLLNKDLSFDQRKIRVMEKYEAYEKRNKTPLYVPPGDIIAPARLLFPRRKDYIKINNRYYTYAYIPSAQYNPQVITGWISPFINACEGIDTDIFFQKIPREQIIFKIRQSIGQNRAFMHDTSDTQASFESLTESIKAGQYLKEGLGNGEDFYYMSILFTISGNSKEEIDWKYREFKKMLSTMDIGLERLSYEGEQAFLSSLPLCRLDANIYKKAKRNVLTSGAASTYPFTAFEMVDEDGILLGRNLSNSSLCMLNIFDTKKFPNANVFCAGMTGSGKTFSMLTIAMRMRMKHIPVCLIAPEKDHEFERVTKAMGGEFIRLGPGSPHCINVMEILKTDETVNNMLDGSEINSVKLSEKIQDLKTFFKLLIPDMDYEEKELLDEALMRTYEAKGITTDNDSLLLDPSNPKGPYKEMPILGDLREELLKMEKEGKHTSRIATIIKTLVSGSGSSFNARTNVNLNNEFTVIGLEHLSDTDLLPLGMFISIHYAFSKIKENRILRKALIIDEWWKFAFDPLAARYSLKIAKTIRAYGGSLILATQQLSDIFALENGRYGEPVLNNCNTKIIMKLEPHDAEQVQRVLHLTSIETSQITKFHQGEALLVANSSSIAIKFEAGKKEYDLITTDRRDIERQLEEMVGSKEDLKKLRVGKVDAMIELFDEEISEIEFRDYPTPQKDSIVLYDDDELLNIERTEEWKD